MTQVDQFESVFRSAVKEPFRYVPVSFSRILVVTDLEQAAAQLFSQAVQQFLPLGEDADIVRDIVTGDRFQTTRDLLTLIEAARPDLICTYRNLRSAAWDVDHSLGEHLDVLTQKIATPVLVLPHPKSGHVFPRGERTDVVMVVTDHLTNDDRLVNHAVACAPAGATLCLMHIEDEAAFERTMLAVSKIPSIDTQTLREKLAAQLLKEPTDYIASCGAGLRAAGKNLTVAPVVSFGHRLKTYQDFIDNRHADLLVMNTKDDDQLAMHGLAYPLAVELRHIPLLMV